MLRGATGPSPNWYGTIVARVIETRRIARMIASTWGDNLHLRNRYAAFLGKSEILELRGTVLLTPS